MNFNNTIPFDTAAEDASNNNNDEDEEENENNLYYYLKVFYYLFSGKNCTMFFYRLNLANMMWELSNKLKNVS